MKKFELHEIVEVDGRIGTIVFIYIEGKAYVVEFSDDNSVETILYDKLKKID